MKLLKYIWMLVLAALLMPACTDGFEDINKNPNQLSETEPEYLFVSSPINTMMTYGSDNIFWIFGNYSGQISMTGGAYPTYGYDGREGNMYRDIYVKMLLPLIEIERNYGDKPGYENRIAIARIWKSYIFSQAVALWGPIPYTRACMGDQYVKFDSEEFIYLDLLKSLKANADSLRDNGDKYPDLAEPVFKSDVKRWRQFAHSLRLKIASRLIDFEDAEVRTAAHQALNEELDDEGKLLISSNAQNCFMTFAKELKYRNPFFVATTETVLSDGVYPVIHEHLMMYLQAYKDPRLGIFCQRIENENDDYEYFSRPSTLRIPPDFQLLENPHHAKTKEDYSYVSDYFGGRLAKFMLISYPEICCIRAEATYRGIWKAPKKSAKDYYNEAIDAFSNRYDTSISAAKLKTYKEQPGIKWVDAGETPLPVDTVGRSSEFYDYLGISTCYIDGESADENYKRIVVQHWMSLFFQGIDSWTLLRRTQLLQLSPVWYPGDDYGSNNGKEWAYLPQRLIYPMSEMAINPKETDAAIQMVGGSNSLHRKLKFAKPVVEFEEYPNGIRFK